MKRILLLSMAFSFVCALSALAQRTVSGKVTDDSGEGLPGVNVVIKGTTTGVTSDLDGNFQISVPDDNTVLVFSSVGMAAQEVTVGARSVIDLRMSIDTQELQEVVVTGVAGATDKRKLPFTVSTVGEELISNTPGVNAATALQGKIAGVTVITASGEPGSNSDIVLRGAANLIGSNNPLIIIDGIITEGNGNLRDINSEDIESMEVVKGAAAASLYGSRAANGVINIRTKRGADKGDKTTISVRTEIGQSYLTNQIDLATHHPYEVNEAGVVQYGVLSTDHLADNEYSKITNHLDKIFNPGSFKTFSVSVGSTSENTRFYGSYTNNQQAGVVDLVEGYKRNSILVNMDQDLYDNLTFSTSTSLITSTNDQTSEGAGGAFYSLLFMPPDIDLSALNQEDGSKYDWNVAVPASLERNPLYQIKNYNIENARNRFLGSYALEYRPLDFLKLEARYSVDRVNDDTEQFIDKGYLSDDLGIGTNGYIQLDAFTSSYETISLKSTFTKEFGDFDVTGQLYYLGESRESSFQTVNGRNFLFGGVRSLGNQTQDDDGNNLLNADSNTQSEASQNYYVVGNVVYQDKIIVDGMFRRDGSSLFGVNNRWNNFYRASAAYRITEDFNIPKVDELKIRASVGTAGNRPGWEYQYQTLSDGGQKASSGNPDLKSSLQREIEVGFDARMFNRVSLNFSYIDQRSTDMFFNRQLEAAGGGFTSQWVNLDAQLDAKIIEIAANANVISTGTSSLDLGAVFTTMKQTITEFNYQPFLVGEGDAFIYRKGEAYGTIYGYQVATSLNQLTESQVASGLYKVNSDGYVVTGIGTSSEAVTMVIDEDGTFKHPIGNIIPDFTMGLNATYKWKGFTAYVLFDWKQGGDIYNQTKQWTFRELRHGAIDQSGVPSSQQKPVDYFSSLYNVNNPTDYFVEDGSYIKLRELNIRYTYKPSNMAFKQITVGLVGRNLFTFTNYSGYDPEVGSSENGQNWAFDGFSYPNFTTLTGSVELKF